MNIFQGRYNRYEKWWNEWEKNCLSFSKMCKFSFLVFINNVLILQWSSISLQNTFDNKCKSQLLETEMTVKFYSLMYVVVGLVSRPHSQRTHDFNVKFLVSSSPGSCECEYPMYIYLHIWVIWNWLEVNFLFIYQKLQLPSKRILI